MKEKVITVVAVMLGLLAAFFVYQNFYPEDFMKKDETVITMSDIEKNKSVSYTGHPAGEDIPRISGKDEFEEILDIDDVTVEPKGIVSTGISKLKAWESPYYKKAGTGGSRAGARRREVITGWDLLDQYNEYYLLECPDGTYILAQMSKRIAKAIEKGEQLTLPISKKAGISKEVQGYLSEFSDEYDMTMKGVLYTFDDEWYQEHSTAITLIRLGVAFVIWIVTGVLLLLLGEKCLIKKKADYL